MFGVKRDIFCTVLSSTRMDGSFFSVARTTPFTALIPRDVAPAFTAFRAYSICTNLPLGLNVVRLNEYCDSDIVYLSSYMSLMKESVQE